VQCGAVLDFEEYDYPAPLTTAIGIVWEPTEPSCETVKPGRAIQIAPRIPQISHDYSRSDNDPWRLSPTKKADTETYADRWRGAGQDMMEEYDIFLKMKPRNITKVGFDSKNMRRAMPRIAEYDR